MKPSNRRKYAILRRDRGWPFKTKNGRPVSVQLENGLYTFETVDGWINRHPTTPRELTADLVKNRMWKIDHALSDCCGGRGYDEYGEKVTDA